MDRWLTWPDWVEFKNIRYHLIINAFKDLYCAVSRKLPRLVTMLSRTVTGSTPLNSNLKSYQNCQAPSRLKSHQSGRQDQNPRPPNSHSYCGLMADRSEGVITPLLRIQSATEYGYYGFCLGLVRDWKIYFLRGFASANIKDKILIIDISKNSPASIT